jgi:chromosome segregation ATPase
VLHDEIARYRLMLKDIDPLKARINLLEEQNRSEKIKRHEAESRLKQREKEKEELAQQLATTRPREQELRERIAYFERVSLDLERKMEDYNRRENDYIKNITSLKGNLTRVTADRNHFKTSYEQTSEQLETRVR